MVGCPKEYKEEKRKTTNNICVFEYLVLFRRWRWSLLEEVSRWG